jgi:tripartite-type tricarboxylate transporter receptor subunit TctC
MKTLSKCLCICLSLVLATTLLAGCGKKSTYPDKAIDLVCPGGAGSGGDVLLRLIAKYLSEELKVTVEGQGAHTALGLLGLGDYVHTSRRF